MEQRTDEWFAARCGKVTASRIADVMAKTKTGYGAGRANYMAELLIERMTGQPADTYQSAAMLRGIELEQEAVNAYAFYHNADPKTVGFVDHPDIRMSGASPDRLIRTIGLLEVKCPNSATHLETLLYRNIPLKYIYQMQWQMECTKRKWCDYASYDNRFPEEMRLWVQRVFRDDVMIQNIKAAVVEFLDELDSKGYQLMNDYMKVAA
jgi:putative phage-type endonuclease